MIVESNITNDERTYRNFIGIVKAYCPKTNTDEIKVVKTPKGNWRVVDKDGNKLCLVSRNILNDEFVAAKNLLYVAVNA